MITDGEAHPISYFDDDFYRELTVTRDTYASEVAKGLYSSTDYVKVEDGYRKIKFRYYDEEGSLIEMDSCPVMYDGEKGDPGEDGAKGEKGYSYRGVFASSDDVADPVESDYFLSSIYGCIYQYQDIAGVLTWKPVQVADGPELYNQALADGMATFAGSESNPIVSAVNIWCRNLIAKTALIDTLFSNKINIATTGYIQSTGYDGSGTGFRLNGNGSFECVNGSFSGLLQSGNFYTQMTTWNATLAGWPGGYRIAPLASDLSMTDTLIGRLITLFGGDGTATQINWRNTGLTVSMLQEYAGYFYYNGLKYTYCDITAYWGGRSTVTDNSEFYLSFYNNEADRTILYQGHYASSDVTLNSVLYVIISPSSQTLMCHMSGLPSVKPEQSGIIYRSGNNLMIS